jgi:HEPN domain-containing protein
MRKARGDQWILERLAGNPDAPDWGIGFHAQQAVEKMIKAVLSAQSIEYPPTHNLAILLDLVRSEGLGMPPDGGRLLSLTPFGATLRYDDSSVPEQTGPLDQAWAVDCVQRTGTWAEAILGGSSEER